MNAKIFVCGLTVGLAAVAAYAAEATKDEIRGAIRAVQRYNGNSYAGDVRMNAQTGMVFYLAHRGETGNRALLDELGASICDAAYRGRDLALAKDVAEGLLADATAGEGLRLRAANYLSAARADRGDFAGADAAYAPLLAKKDLKPGNYAETWGRRARLFTLREDIDGALKTLEAARRFPSGAKEQWTRAADELLDGEVAKVYSDFHRYEDGFRYLVAKKRHEAALRFFDKGTIGDLSLAANLCREVLQSPDAGWRTRLLAWTWIFTRDPAFADAHPALRPGDGLKCTNDVVAALAYKLTRPQIYHLEGLTTPVAQFGDRPQIIRVWKEYRRLQSVTGACAAFPCAQYAMLAYAGEGDRAAAIAAAEEGLRNGKLKPEERYELSLAVKVLEMKGDAQAVAKSVEAADNELGRGLEAETRLARLERVGALAVVSCDEALARGIAQYRAKVKPRPPKKEYVVRYSPHGVSGIGDWGNIPFRPEQSPYDRKYGGGGAEFLVTDVSTGDRGKAAEASAHSSTTLEAVADDWGVHILRTFRDGRARQFEQGLLYAGSFEEYIAAGENQPYSCFMVRLRKDVKPEESFATAYDSPGHRRIDVTDPTKYRCVTTFGDDAVRTYTGYSWDNFATLIPTKGGAWDFESIFWGPEKCAWNGTESIHGRSTWGRLVFDLPEEARLRILKNQIAKAVAAYRREKVSSRVFEGMLALWQDPVTGDPAFYDACIKPLVEELDRAAERVKPEMSDDDVRDLAENYLAKWRDLRFTIGRLRTEYLGDEFFK